LSHNTVYNQDDCVAINEGKNILITNMYSSGGHGLSIGSVGNNEIVSNVTFIGNTVTNSVNGFRIKMESDAIGASVSGIIYQSNTVSTISQYGVLIDQSYPSTYGTPGTSSPISGISFTGGTTTVTVNSGAYTLGIDCGDCSGTWDFSGLHASGGKGSRLTLGNAKLSGGSY